jgi:hypothetical protein
MKRQRRDARRAGKLHACAFGIKNNPGSMAWGQ